MDQWRPVERPGFFGRRRDEKAQEYDDTFGKGYWRLQWVVVTNEGSTTIACDFAEACERFYENSYNFYFQHHPEQLVDISKFIDVYDNALTNIHSGTDYTKQEAYSTHIQDIAVRNVLRKWGLEFTRENGRLLQIRGSDSEGWKFNPGQIPFAWPELITSPSLRPSWAQPGSVEDFWQSNKWLMVRQ